MEAPIDLTTLNPQQFHQFINSFDTILTDCDGVIYNYYEPIPGVVETINKLIALKKHVKFVTNNTYLSVDILHKKLNMMGIQSNEEDIVYPTMSMISYLKSIHFKKKVFLCSLMATKQDFLNAGFQIADSGPVKTEETMTNLMSLMKDDPDIGAVILDMDFTLNYQKLMRASVFLKRPDVLFLVGVTDEKIPVLGNHIMGPGYFSKIMENFTGRRALIFGKPNPSLGVFIKQKYNIQNPERTLFIGDSLHQDMSFATHSGFRKLLVLTGINSLEDAQHAEAEKRPDYYINSLGDMRFLLE